MKKIKLYYDYTGWLRVLGIIIPFFLIVGTSQLIVMSIFGLDFENREVVETSL